MGKYSKEIKLKAKALFLDGADPQDISEKLDININSLRSWINKGSKSEIPWRELRYEVTKEDMEVMFSEAANIGTIKELGLNVIQRALLNLEVHEIVLDDSATLRLAKLLGIIDKLDTAGDEEVEETEEPDISPEDFQHPFLKQDVEEQEG